MLERFVMQGSRPRCVVVIHVESVFFQCARAVYRAGLWQPVPPEAARRVPSPGQILAALTDAQIDGEAYDRDLPARQRATLY